VRVNGIDVSKLDEGELLALREEMGMLFQGGALFDSMLVGENVGLPCESTRRSRAPDRGNRWRSSPWWAHGDGGTAAVVLSGGMKKRAVCSLAMNPKIMLTTS
jgi:phospholipid/cholesterol/gamma-HCH transport system ATP-binding protein